MDDLTDFAVSCPGCGTSCQVPVLLAGTVATCESCQVSFILPEAPSAASPATRSAASETPRKSRTFLKNLLLLLTGAVLVWSIATYFKKSGMPHSQPPTAQTAPLSEKEESPVSAAPEPVIATTQPNRLPPPNQPPHTSENSATLTRASWSRSSKYICATSAWVEKPRRRSLA